MAPLLRPRMLFGIQNKQDAVVIANRIVEIIGQQAARLEAHVHLHGKRSVAPDAAGEHALVILLSRHGIFQRAIAEIIPAVTCPLSFSLQTTSCRAA